MKRAKSIFELQTEEIARKREAHKAKLAALHGVEDNPKLDQCYKLALHFGKFMGWEKVEWYFSAMVSLIK